MAILRLHSPKMISSKILDTEIVLHFHTVKHTTCKACRMHMCGWCAVVFTSASLNECDVTRVRRYYLTNTSTAHSYYYRNLQLDYCALCVLPKNLPTSNTFFKTFVVALKGPFPKKMLLRRQIKLIIYLLLITTVLSTNFATYCTITYQC